MDDFSTFARDFGMRPQGKAAPMSQSRPSAAGSDGGDRPPLFDDVFCGPPKYTSSKTTSSFPDYDYGSIFKNKNTNSESSNSNRSSSPVYDKPVYDEDIFDGLPGVKSKSASSRVSYDENVFATMSNHTQNQSVGFDDFLGNLGRSEKVESKSAKSTKGFDDLLGNLGRRENLESKSSKSTQGFDDLLGNLGRSEKLESKSNKNTKEFDDLLPGFGTMSSQRSNRSGAESSQSQQTSVNSPKPTSSAMDDPFVVLESTSASGDSSSKSKVFSDPLDEMGKLGNSTNTKADSSSASGVVFDDIDPLEGFGKAPAFPSEINKVGAHSRTGSSDDKNQSTFRTEPIGKSSLRDSASRPHNMSDDDFEEFHEPMFDMPSISTGSRKVIDQMSSPSYVNVEANETNINPSVSPDEHVDSSDDAWLTVSEIPLFTQPTSSPPPSRPPPPIPAGKALKSVAGFYHSNAKRKSNEFPSSSSPRYSQYSQSPTVKSNKASSIDELENFAMGGIKHTNGEYTHGSDDVDANSSAAASAAAMKDAMDRAEAKFRHAKEVREKEYVKTARQREPAQVERDEHVMPDEQEREYRVNEDRSEYERRQRSEEEERRRLERERERAREEREKVRQVIERANREARERAAIEARERATAEARRKSERTAVERAQAEARERAGKAAVQRVQAEVRERAAADAKEKEEKAAAEAREKENANARAEAEARRRAERAAVDRASAEARQRAASAARMNQQKHNDARMNQQQRNDNDLESFFSMNSRPSSAPRPRENASDSTVDPMFQSKVGSESANKTSSVNTAANIRKTSSATNIVDDLSSIFGGTASSGDFQDIEGETEERRRARLDRHQRTQERAAKALDEKNQRDLQNQRDQEERHRIGATLDIEIKRWAAGKEGNLRALLSTMQYVLWPECGWTPVSLTDLIMGASVKKAYRKATLCIHPDKVQQKGANLQQKYIAEKVFDLLKEAWNKFNSEELF